MKSERGSRFIRLPLAFRARYAPAGFDVNRRTSREIRRLLCRSLRHRDDGYVGAAFCFGIELNATLREGEKGVVLAHADIVAGMPLGATLAHENIAGSHAFAAERLDAEATTTELLPLGAGEGSRTPTPEGARS